MTRRIVLAIILAVGVSAAPASATTIDFFGALPGGTFSGDATGAQGANIPIEGMTVVYDSGVWYRWLVDAGILNFAVGDEGNLIQVFGGLSGTADLDSDAASNGPNLNIAGGSLLLSGTFNFWNVTPFGAFTFVSGSGPDTKNLELLRQLGIPVDTQWEFGAFELRSGTTNSADILNAPIPEPASMFLLGSGVVGLVAARRRRKRQAPPVA